MKEIHEAAKRIVALDPTDPHMTLLERELLDRAISDMEKAIAQFRTGGDLVEELRPLAQQALGEVEERQRIVEWLRTTSRARGVLISIHSSQDIARCADAIERGEHEEAQEHSQAALTLRGRF